MPACVEGMVSLRGQLVPIIDLAKYAGIVTGNKPEIMIVSRIQWPYSRLLVEAVGLHSAPRLDVDARAARHADQPDGRPRDSRNRA